MIISRCRYHACSNHLLRHCLTLYQSRRCLLTLAIETSCDDTSVAVLEKHNNISEQQTSLAPRRPCATLHFHEKITADNSQFHGIHPLISLESHQTNLGTLINKALQCLPFPSNNNNISNNISINASSGTQSRRLKPDLISVTRGPGMRSNLFTGLDTAKGLAIAWQVPLIGVHHMQAHALTPRLVSALNSPSSAPNPSFPFLSLLISGGHTLLLHSQTLTEHSILATTTDIAIGDALDKIARIVLPRSIIDSTPDVMYARLLEEFVFPLSSPSDPSHYNYTPPSRRVDELTRYESLWGWTLGVPLAETRSGSKYKSMEFSFSGLESACKRVIERRGDEMEDQERKQLGREGMRIAFEHLASRVVRALQGLHDSDVAGSGKIVNTLVVSGGVASNGFLRTILRAFLSARSFSHIQLSFPPPSLCTDNAAMIAWTGIEMYEAGYESELGCKAIRKWPIDEIVQGIGVSGKGIEMGCDSVEGKNLTGALSVIGN